MSNLFDAAGMDQGPSRPLAERLRPVDLDQVIGQAHLFQARTAAGEYLLDPHQ